MDANCRQLSGFCVVPSGYKGGAQRRLSVVLCLLALTIQLVAPVVHMWELTMQQEVIVLEALASPWTLAKTQGPIALASAARHTQPLPHDTTVCPVCQALAHLRNWTLPQAGITSDSTTTSWLVPLAWLPPVNVHLGAVAARAPPSPRS
jgi:hypothetical protein